MIIIFEHEGVNGVQSFNLSYDKMTKLRHEATYKQALNMYFPQEIVYRGSLIVLFLSMIKIQNLFRKR